MDEFGAKVYNTKVSLNNKQGILNLFYILLKYGVDLEEILKMMKKNN